MNARFSLFCLFVGAAGVVSTWPVFASAAGQPTDPSKVTAELRERCVGVLHDVVANAAFPARIRAAEFLLALDYPEGMSEIMAKESATIGSKPYDRIAVWECRARAAVQPGDREQWIGRIRSVLFDPDAPDRTEAAHALGKLRYTVPKEELTQFEQLAGQCQGPLEAYTVWVLARSGVEDAERRLGDLLESDEADTRAAAAYALAHLRRISPELQAKLFAAARREPSGSPARIRLIHAAAVHAPADQRAAFKAELLAALETDNSRTRIEACEALMQLGSSEDLPVLVGLLEDDNGAIRARAACAILRAGRRVPHRVSAIDWMIIALYAAGMLAVGWYFSRRTTTTEDYLLGGRKMGSISVGLSLFASLLSTITYLAVPGEMILYGPVYFIGSIAAFPLIVWVIGWFMIPFIMKLKVTSAYEILEIRLGLAVRMLGSLMFLVLRLVWMAVVIYATVDKVLVPLLGLSPALTPYVCALIGLVTLIYTSMGGLRAVIVTDVTQTLILFCGAILVLVLISVYFGGVGGWWPSHLPVHWPERTWIDFGSRMSFVGAFVATFTWFVCTSGSDQIAIQRYLATQDVKAARKALTACFVADGLVIVLLAMVGLALLAYFRANPQMVPDGQAILDDPDTLFSRFIGFGLPTGISGLVVAAILAAAMSSLSSGLNSSCSVITVDFVDRFRRNKQTELNHVRLAKIISVIVGIVIVLLSSLVGLVHGNLLALAFKVCNLLTAPLFGLFFMAMFVRWATGFGTLVGALFGLVVVVLVSYWEEITGTPGISFIWAMPLSLLTQIAVGMLASLIPVGQKPPAKISPEA